ncbi:MAG: nuclear transport factor 2 family protein [Terracidiphilus sp.]|jgi:ketosteroid isomerase-like protein
MNRLFVCFSVVLLACGFAAAQTPSSDAAAPAPQTMAESGVTTTVSPEVAQFQKIEDSWSDAVNRRDQYALELVLSPLFVDVSAQGDVTTRNQQVVLVLNGQDKSLYLTQKVITVRMLGDIAVANGTYSLEHKVNAAEVDEKGVFTHVFERVRGGWLCINSQRTVLRTDANSKQKKQSTAESPFHIPFLTKGDKGPQ